MHCMPEYIQLIHLIDWVIFKNKKTKLVNITKTVWTALVSFKTVAGDRLPGSTLVLLGTALSALWRYHYRSTCQQIKSQEEAQSSSSAFIPTSPLAPNTKFSKTEASRLQHDITQASNQLKQA
ncbi:hypothetical protein EDC96DRAFT_550680, partial [Choanephora cucurbitarum]